MRTFLYLKLPIYCFSCLSPHFIKYCSLCKQQASNATPSHDHYAEKCKTFEPASKHAEDSQGWQVQNKKEE
jgi:hypothetical protein